MHDAERARSALSHLDPTDRDVWVRAAMCIKDGFGDAGFEMWDSWGSQCDSHTPSAAKSVWRSVKVNGKTTIASLFYDAKQQGWADDTKYKKPTKAEIDARNAKAAERAKQLAAEEAAAHAAAAKWAQRLWDAATPCTTHPYLVRKGVPAHGLRVGRWERVSGETGEVFTVSTDALLVPIVDRTRKLWSLQAIFPSKQSNGRDKDYLAGGAKSGKFHAIGKPQQRDGRHVFVLAEGYATAASVHEATGHMVLVCFDKSGLMPVARSLRERAPDAWIVIAADNDTHTDGNPGLTAARKVAKEVGGLVAVPPPGDFNDLQLAEGLDAVAQCFEVAFAPEPEPDPEPEQDAIPPDVPAPVDTAPPMPPDDATDAELLRSSGGHFVILGYDGDDYYVFSKSAKQVCRRTRADFTDTGLLELAPLNWWETHFPNGSGKPGINKLTAFEWFISVARARGVYDERKVRGRGAWRDGGRSVFHHGDHLTVDGVHTPIGGVVSKWVYPMARSMPPLIAKAATDEDGQYLLEVAKMARWTRPASAALLLGWVFLSPVCGALSWRPHIWLTGAAGSGKTTIFEGYAQALLAGISEPLAGDSSEAGIRQAVRADAIPVLIDEFEPNDETARKRMKQVLTAARQASSETSAQTAKGTISGDGMRFHVRSMFCFSSINTMLDKDSDQSRITPLVLMPPIKSGSVEDQWPKLQEALHAIARDGTWPSRLLSRSTGMTSTIIENEKVFCRVAAKVFGTQRKGDQYGTLMSGAWGAISSKVATDAEALALIESYDWTEHTEISGGPGDPEKALAAILESKIRVSQTDVTVFEILSEACGKPSASIIMGKDQCIDILRRNGIRIEAGMLLFGVNTGTLRALVKDTAYATDLRGQLSRLPNASNMGNRTRKFAGVNSKLIGVPLSSVVDDLDDDEPPI